MCCVIPPASVSTTDASRIASSSVVLPWSTWPMIVTTGGRGARSVFRVVEVDGLELLLRRVLDRDLAVELRADDLDLLVGERLRRRPHLPEVHEDLDQLGHRDAERLREVLDGDAGLDADRPGGGRGGRLPGLRRRVTAVARLAARAAASATLDDDTPLASAGASARADRSIRSLSSVSHVGQSRTAWAQACLAGVVEPWAIRRAPRSLRRPRDSASAALPLLGSCGLLDTASAGSLAASAWCAGTPQ